MSKHSNKHHHKSKPSNSAAKPQHSSGQGSGHGGRGSVHASGHTSNHASQAAAPAQSGLTGPRLMVVFGLMAIAFFGAYNFASARNSANGGSPGSAAANYFDQVAGAPAGGGGCCGGGGAPIEGQATVEGDVQKISVDTASGTFNPNVIKVKAGVPLEIAFSQSSGGCLSGVYFPDFNINEDLTSGGKTVTLPALQPGTYQFFCQMQMVSAQIVAE